MSEPVHVDGAGYLHVERTGRGWQPLRGRPSSATLAERMAAACTDPRRAVVAREAAEVAAWAVTVLDGLAADAAIGQAIGAARRPPGLPRYFVPAIAAAARRLHPGRTVEEPPMP